MTYFDWLMAIIGVIDFACLIFMVVCKINPKVLSNKTVREIYIFMEGYGAREKYEDE